MPTTIKIKNGSGAPTSSDLVQGELAIDLTNKRLYTEDGSANILELGTSPSTIDINAGTIDGTTIGGSTPAAGTFTTLTANGNVVLGDAATDTVTVTADVASDLIPSADGTYDLGASGSEWQDLFIDGTANIDSLVADTADINGGTIDGTVIGGASAAAGTFTTVTASGEIAANGGIALGDNDKATFGASDDLEIYHDGTHGRIYNNTGSLYIQASDDDKDIYFMSDDGSGGTAIYIAVDGSTGATSLRHYGNTKLATTATGIDVTGTVTADGLTVDGNATISSTVPVLRFDETDTTDTNFQINVNAGSLAFQSNNDAFSSNTKRMQIDNNGDISFYEDTGTTPKLFWDASAERLGIGTTSPSGVLSVVGDNSVPQIRIDTASTGQNARIDLAARSTAGAFCISRLLSVSEENALASALTIETRNSLGTIAERMRITSSGDLLVGGTTVVDITSWIGGAPAHLNVQSTGGGYITLYRNDTSVGSGNFLGGIGFYGNDTTSNTPTLHASIQAIASGAHAAGDNPTDIAFGTTPDGSETVAEVARFTESKYLRFASGTGGIQFGGDTAAANALDDYEEGVFIPAFTFSTSGSVTYTTQDGFYRKVGSVVFVSIAIVIASVSSPTGNVNINNLPFTGLANSFSGITIGQVRSLVTAKPDLKIYQVGNSSNLNFSIHASNAGFSQLQGSDFQAGTVLFISGSYITT